MVKHTISDHPEAAINFHVVVTSFGPGAGEICNRLKRTHETMSIM